MRFYNDKPLFFPHPQAAAAAVAVIGAAVTIEGQRQQARARKSSLKGQAAIQALQADEMLRQAEIELDIFGDQAAEKIGDVTSSYARAGVDIGSGSPLLVIANSERRLKNAESQLERKRLEEARLTRAGAQGLQRSANSIDPTLQNVGTALAGLGQAINSNN